MRLARLLLGLPMAAAVLLAQYPTQYPPQTYPPNTYPPNTYPPNTYPPNTYPPNTYPLPGRVPVGVPIPEVKLPRRGEKDKGKGSGDSEVKMTLAAVDGSLRRLREKDLVLQAGPKKLLRFRLLAKTKFLNKEGEPIRDSLLHPGDQLSVQVNADDEETALRVTLLKSGSEAERRTAELPFDESTARAPRAEDLGKAKTVSVQQDSPAAEAETPAPGSPTPAVA